MEQEKIPKTEERTSADQLQQRSFQQGKELRMSDIVHTLRKHAVLIAVLTVIGLVVGIGMSVVSYMRGEMSKQYAINTAIAVTSQNENGLFTTGKTNDPNSTDIYLAEDIVDSVIYVLKSDKTLTAAVGRLGLLGVTNRDIYNNLDMRQYNDTQIIEITLYWRSAQEGVEILSAINQVAPDILIDTLKIGNVSMINAPTARYLIGGSINASMWGYMMLLGLCMGVGLAILDLLLRPTLLNSRDMERFFGLEVLGEFPERKHFFEKKRNLLLGDEEDSKHAAVLDNYVSLAHILKARLKEQKLCVYITSAGQYEGKTTIAAHTAVQLAELGMKVLLIDFDTRNPRLGGMFLDKVDYDHSLNALYRGETTKAEAITSLTASLDLLPSVLERKPLPLDDALLWIVRELKQDYDVVLVDTAPVGRVAETMRLNQLADIALLVVRFDTSTLEDIRSALARLSKSGMKLMGCVVNGVKELGNHKARGYYGYGYHNSTAATGQRREKTEKQKQWDAWEKSHEPTPAAGETEHHEEAVK